MFRLQMQQSLEDLLIQTKLISSSQLAVARRDAEINNKRLAPTLIDLGFVSDRKFAEWMAGVTSLPIVNPIAADAVADLEDHIPAHVAREYDLVPIDVEADELTVATINPLEHDCFAELQTTIGMKIRPVIGVYGNLREIVQRFYPALKPRAFDPAATIAAPEGEPFAYGDDTMLRIHSRQFAFDQSDDADLGSETRILPASPERSIETDSAAEVSGATHTSLSQLDRIEHHVSDVVRMIESLQRRIDAIDSTLARIVNRQR